MIIVISVAATTPLQAGSTLTAEQLFVQLRLDKQELEQLRQGEILTLGMPGYEQTPKELAALLLMKVQTDVPTVASVIRRWVALDFDNSGAIGFDLITDANALQQATTTLSRNPQLIEELASAGPGERFNLSGAEITHLQAVLAGSPTPAKLSEQQARTVLQLYREALSNRVEQYRRHGLRGIEPYLRNEKRRRAYPSQQLRMAAQSVALLQDYFPVFYRDYLHYPDYPAERERSYRHRFLVIRQRVEGRPHNALAHWMFDIREDYAIIAQRQFYSLHTYDSLQVIILCLPYEDGALVALLNQTFTPKVRGFLSPLRHVIGRNRIEAIIRPLFEKLQGVFFTPPS